jgi:catechol 1,2-dioxygenase
MMDRKKFIRALSLIPLLGILFNRVAKAFDLPAACKTQKDVEGPFYKPNAPVRSVIETEGQPLRIRGKVCQASDCKTPVANAILDVWHCNNNGDYDMQGFKGRGQVTSDIHGGYAFTTILPPPYGTRPRHIHFKVRAEGFRELTTQLYFQGDPNIRTDFARNAETRRVIALTVDNGIKEGIFHIYL